jgi:heat shock protein HslJ
VLVDRRVTDPDRPLEGTRWLVDTVLEQRPGLSQVARPGLPPGAELIFESSSLRATTPCGTIRATTKREGDRLVFSGQTIDATPCDEAAAMVHAAVLKAIGAPARISIHAGSLTLTVDSGDGLILIAR